MKKIFLFLFLYSLNCLAQHHFSSNTNYQLPSINNHDSIITIRIAAVGDIMCHYPQFQYSQVSKDSFDFVPVFRYVNKYLADADFTMGNLETVTEGSNKKYSGCLLYTSDAADE